MRIVENLSELIDRLDRIVAIADNYKTELGFWPRSSLEDGIKRGRLLAADGTIEGRETTIGFVVFGGVFPNGRIQAVAVDPTSLRQGVAQFLVDNVVARMESEGYLAILAKPAKDLQVAQNFYEKNHFLTVRIQSGGAARNREIVVRERILKSPSLLTAMELRQPPPLLLRSDAHSNLWVIDINVLFDLLKLRRTHYKMAVGVFAAALEGRVRIAVTSEFSNELTRASAAIKDDPLLKLADALPRLRGNAEKNVKDLAEIIHTAVFTKRKPSQAGTPQAHSDCMHLAECIAGNASAFVTSDGVLLRNRRLIRETWGLEVVALEDFHDVLTSTDLTDDFKPVRGKGFRTCTVSAEVARGIAEKLQPKGLNYSYFVKHATRASAHFLVAFDDRQAATALLAASSPVTLGDAHRVLLLVDHERPNAELIAEMLLSNIIDAIGRAGLNLINLEDIPGQIAARKAALQAGFISNDTDQFLSKPALGAPITPASFSGLSERAGLAFGSKAPQLFPASFDGFDALLSTDRTEFRRTEDLLSPTLIVTNNRQVSIQPIARPYADELLGTSPQTSLLDQFEGAFRSQKTYVCSGRSKNLFKTNQLILFYESTRTGGRGAVIAAARIDNVVTQQKNETLQSDMKRTVLESVDRFSASEEVTLTGFSSLLRFPRPVSLDELRMLGAVGTQNLQTTTVIATAVAQEIFDRGWANER
ncbi:GNAT family N-acetyltransferase [Roseibium marinum]|uniref:Acetyltransferase (GNAT) family protein n=1 Tax=Roseibium marinum TaxID=281252 RepID=A0A2S3UX76_9HYPH|nr:GNAT family N-acetyltransferase [Roseibium marinum]POF32332.1 acetyltransferase (GNAT) family protein [Roseibium marinum]